MPGTDQATHETIQKVKLAMLSMQRDAWEQGVGAQALLEMGETELVILFAKDAVVRQGSDGRLALMGGDGNIATADPGANGEAVLFAARVTGDESLCAAGQAMLAYFMEKAPRTVDGVLYHHIRGSQLWIDAAYMAPPFLAVAGEPAEAVHQIEGYRKYLWDPQKKLFSHIWDDLNKKFGRKDAWGVGNGWAAAGMTRIIRSLPASMPDQKNELVTYVKEVLDGCLAHQRPDGLFHDVVDNPSSFIETNLAQMLSYTIFRGLKGGWLDGRYRAAGERMRAAAYAKVDRYGLVQGVCGSPNFDHSGTATEGQSFFLLMEAAYQDLS